MSLRLVTEECRDKLNERNLPEISLLVDSHYLALFLRLTFFFRSKKIEIFSSRFLLYDFPHRNIFVLINSFPKIIDLFEMRLDTYTCSAPPLINGSSIYAANYSASKKIDESTLEKKLFIFRSKVNEIKSEAN